MKYSINNIIKKILLFLMFFYCIFYSTFIMLQLEFLGKVIISHTQFRTFILIIETLYLILFLRKGVVKSKFSKIMIPLLICSTLSLLLGIIEFENLTIPIGVFTNNLLFIFIVYTLGFNNNKINLKPWINSIIIFGIINAILCILQYLNGNLIVYSTSNENVFKSVFYFGKMIRSCGLYTSALDVGILLSFCTIYCIYNHKNLCIWKKNINLLIIILLIVAIITTRTRNVYLFMAFALFYMLLDKILKGNKKKITCLYLIITILAALFITFKGNSIGNSTENLYDNIYSSTSLDIRLNNWNNWYNNYFHQNIFEIFWGNCRGQSTGWGTDNMYLEYLSSFGIIGLLLIFKLFSLIVKQLKKKNDLYANIGLLFILTIFSFGMFNLPETFFMIYLPMLIAATNNTDNKESENL